MPVFASQFDRARVYTDIYTGPPGDTTWRTPRGAAGGGLLAAGVAAGLVAGGIVAGLVAAAAIDAYFDGDADHRPDGYPAPHSDAEAHPHTTSHPVPASSAGATADAHSTPHNLPAHTADAATHPHTSADHAPAHPADAAPHAHAGAVGLPHHTASGAGSASSGGAHASGADAGRHAEAWGAGWGQGWEHGWDAESSHRLAIVAHAGGAPASDAANHPGEASSQAAHPLLAASTGPESAHDGPRGAAPVSGADADPGHLHPTGTESRGDDGAGHGGAGDHVFGHDGSGHDGSGHDGSGHDHDGDHAFGHDGSGHDHDGDQHLHAGHEDVWAHDGWHGDAAFGGDDPSSPHHGAP
jgi:hypothetical protein